MLIAFFKNHVPFEYYIVFIVYHLEIMHILWHTIRMDVDVINEMPLKKRNVRECLYVISFLNACLFCFDYIYMCSQNYDCYLRNVQTSWNFKIPLVLCSRPFFLENEIISNWTSLPASNLSKFLLILWQLDQLICQCHSVEITSVISSNIQHVT